MGEGVGVGGELSKGSEVNEVSEVRRKKGNGREQMMPLCCSANHSYHSAM